MKQRLSMVFLVVAMVLLVLSLVACSQQPAASSTTSAQKTTAAATTATSAASTGSQVASNWPDLNIGSSGVSGSSYPIAVGWAEMMKKYYGIKATPMATGGSAPNASLIAENKIQLASITSDIMEEAYLGTGLYSTGKVPLMSIMRGHERIYQLVVRDESSIKTPADIKGKKFMYYQPSGPCQIMYGEGLMAAYNIKPNEYTRLEFKDTASATAAIKDGITDVIMSGACPNAAILELSKTTKIRFIPISVESQKYITDKYKTFEAGQVPKDVYGAGLPSENLPSVKDRNWLACRADLPVDLVYAATKAVLDHPDEFSKFSPLCNEYILSNAVGVAAAPFHPGAIKYYKEKGVWTAAAEARQAELTK